jgi:hypothetical protein
MARSSPEQPSYGSSYSKNPINPLSLEKIAAFGSSYMEFETVGAAEGCDLFMPVSISSAS